jgi:hypothetical protein
MCGTGNHFRRLPQAWQPTHSQASPHMRGRSWSTTSELHCSSGDRYSRSRSAEPSATIASSIAPSTERSEATVPRASGTRQPHMDDRRDRKRVFLPDAHHAVSGLTHTRFQDHFQGSDIVSFEGVPLDAPLPQLTYVSSLPLFSFIGAAHANVLANRRLMPSLDSSCDNGAITHKTKLQATVTTSYTKDEFLAAVHASKIAKYSRSVLAELGFPPSGSTTLYKENEVEIAMIKESPHSSRSSRRQPALCNSRVARPRFGSHAVHPYDLERC